MRFFTFILLFLTLAFATYSQNFSCQNKILTNKFSYGVNNTQVTPTYVNIHFFVDLYDGPIDHDNDTVFISGSFNNWLKPGAQGSVQMIDYNDNYYYSASIQLEENTGDYEYKYYINSGFEGAEWTGEPNRTFTVGSRTIDLYDVWGYMIGVNDFMLSNSLVYPNPFYEEITIDNLHNSTEILIHNVLGQAVFNLHTLFPKITINTSMLKKGIYFVTIIDENKNAHTEKIIKR